MHFALERASSSRGMRSGMILNPPTLLPRDPFGCLFPQTWVLLNYVIVRQCPKYVKEIHTYSVPESGVLVPRCGSFAASTPQAMDSRSGSLFHEIIVTLSRMNPLPTGLLSQAHWNANLNKIHPITYDSTSDLRPISCISAGFRNSPGLETFLISCESHVQLREGPARLDGRRVSLTLGGRGKEWHFI
jgi:hypothetical protein